MIRGCATEYYWTCASGHAEEVRTLADLWSQVPEIGVRVVKQPCASPRQRPYQGPQLRLQIDPRRR